MYNFGFINTYNDTIIHLIHWQYWWWFWFTYILCLYYVFFLRFLYFRSLKFNPKIATSFRSHGKWGDFIICALPVSWCLNILSNSTTLLKLIEWQSESSFFTLRVRGKQWYWVYKIDFKSLNEVFNKSFNKKIGNTYYKSSFFSKSNINNYILLNANNKNLSLNINFLKLKENFFLNNKNFFSYSFFNINYINSNSIINQKSFFNLFSFYKNILIFKNYFFINKKINFSDLFNLTKFKSNNLDISYNRYFRDVIFKKNKISLLKSMDIYYNENFLIKFNFITNKQRKVYNNNYIVLKQKPIADWLKYDKTSQFYKISDYVDFYSDSFLLNLDRKISYNSNMRLLKLNKMIFLPTNNQITIITNSFDVIHSWFIPGLGLKMDCVPGRSTHHTLYINLPGIYYGQCAEICGRFHHHMPIRLCALNIEHFFLWYNHFILPSIKNFDLEKTNFKFSGFFKKKI